MADDLVKRLRDAAKSGYDIYGLHCDIELEAASRIEELERANSDLANEFTAAASFLRQGADRIKKLEAALLVALGMLSEMGLSYAEKCEMAYEHLLKIKVAALVEEKKDE